MTNLDFDALRALVMSRAGLSQLLLLAFVWGFAWLAARTVRARLPDDLSPGLRKIGAGSAHRLVFPLLFLVLVWLGRALLAKFHPVPLLNVAIPLALSFVVIRLGLYLLRHLIPPSPLLKSSERFVASGVWLLVAMYLTGLLPELVGSLEDTKFNFGKQVITLRQIIEAMLWASVTVFVALSVSRIVEQRVMATASIDMSSRVVISKFVRALALTLAVLIALPLVGIPLSLLSVFGGALGVGLGLGLQKIASNYVSGFIILLDRSIRLGDLITVEGRQGVVIGIKSRYTVVRALDGTEAIIPNDALITNTVVNHSYSDPVVAVRLGVTISYDSDLEKARGIVQAAAESHSRVLKEPAPVVWLKQLGDNGIELELTAWINDPDQGQGSLRSDLLLQILQDFRAAHIAVPYPHREVRIIGTSSLNQSSELR